MTEERPCSFLEEPDPRRLLRAAADNHVAWFARTARAAGGVVESEDDGEAGLTFAYIPGPEAEVVIPFPRLAEQDAGERLDSLLARLWRIEGLTQISCWALLEPTTPPDLGVRLVARGFEQGWQPHWMQLDLQALDADRPESPGVRVELADEAPPGHADDLPYHSPEAARRLGLMSHVRPTRVWRFVARLQENGRLVGQSVLNLTTGPLGVAGIFDVGVAPDAQRRGVGTAVTLAALRLARELGGRYALLNSTEMGEPLYRRLGFESLGRGRTWWLHQDVLQRPPPDVLEIAFGEAVGRGDLPTLSALASDLPPEKLDAPLPCRLTPVQLAVQSDRPESVELLVGLGATLDIVSAWDLGRREEATDLLKAAPELANLRSGRWGATPLHIAALRDDADLTRVLLAAELDLGLKDYEFHSTPLGWAQHMGRTEIAALIQERAGAADA